LAVFVFLDTNHHMTTNPFLLDAPLGAEHIDLDELYEKKKQRDMKQQEVFNKILGRVHTKIKQTSRHGVNERTCWFEMPTILLGVGHLYDQSLCIAYIIDKLRQNKFVAEFTYPNTILISWAHWMPSYARHEIKTKTGLELNEFGHVINDPTPPLVQSTETPSLEPEKPKKQYVPTSTYKPLGIYSTLASVRREEVTP
jgi:hypothetical protein